MFKNKNNDKRHHLHAGADYSGRRVEYREDVDDESQFLMRKYRVQRHEAERREHHVATPGVQVYRERNEYDAECERSWQH